VHEIVDTRFHRLLRYSQEPRLDSDFVVTSDSDVLLKIVGPERWPLPVEAQWDVVIVNHVRHLLYPLVEVGHQSVESDSVVVPEIFVEPLVYLV